MRSNYFFKSVTFFLILIFPLIRGQSTEKLTNKTFSAQVIGISDGDTMEVLYEKNPLKIRLAHIDAPEKKGSQPFGNNAKQALSALCFGRYVTVIGGRNDRYHRLIAVIINDKNQNINKEMLKLGMAWHYKKYSQDADYAQLENQARRKRIGLWLDKNPIEPWLWRKLKKNESQYFKSRVS